MSESGPANPGRRTLLSGFVAVAASQLAGCGGGGGSGGTGTTVQTPPATGATATDLPIVPLVQGTVDGSGTRVFSLQVGAGTTTFRTGVATRTLGYNGALLGPALHLRRGERVRIDVQNGLTESTTVHWHGLAGLLLIDDPAIGSAGLPSSWGVDDVALVLQDKRFDSSGQIDYTLTANDLQVGYTGDVLLVNGAVAPVFKAPQQWVRLRLLNGCNSRTLSLRLAGNLPLSQVANEAGLLAQPVVRSSVTLVPGERAEVLVNLGTASLGQDIALYASYAATGMGMGSGGGQGEIAAVTIRVDKAAQAGAMTAVPASLPAASAITAPAGATARTIRLDGGMMGSPFTLNGRLFDIARIDMTVPAATTEVWTFTNTTMMAHPMHVHGVRMSILTRNGAAPRAEEQGLRDTFNVDSMETVQVAVRTAGTPSASPLMFHCHILEHEDAGMMGQFITA
ncbi:MAG TPA: multicopper oxidase domain-containing protein [Aquabacterium sp.]|nr:multicopper oxidase domain-containing protein [Aquabacterium sp.]